MSENLSHFDCFDFQLLDFLDSYFPDFESCPPSPENSGQAWVGFGLDLGHPKV